jgi:hypothetical protein
MSTTAARASGAARAGSSSTPQMRTGASSAPGKLVHSSRSAARSGSVNARVSGVSSGTSAPGAAAGTFSFEVVGTASFSAGSFEVVVAMWEGEGEGHA